LDLNYLYHRQQISRYMADHAACRPSRLAHRDMAKRYSDAIAAAKAANARSDRA